MASQTIATRTTTTDTNDLYLNAEGNIAIVSGIESVAQVCGHVCKTRLGEVPLQTDIGIPYFETVFTGNPNIQQFEASLSLALSEVTDVTQVKSITVTVTGKTLNYMAVIATIYGETTING